MPLGSEFPLETPVRYTKVPLQRRIIILILGLGAVIICHTVLRSRFTLYRDILFQPVSHHTETYGALRDHCREAEPILASEFVTRQRKLAEALYKLDSTAYIAEPGSNALYFANISKSSWYLSERAFLIVISPQKQAEVEHPLDNPVTAQITIITPRFEALRASLLVVPHDPSLNIKIVQWAEDSSPYEALKNALPSGINSVVLDESMRKFIVDGIANVGLRVHPGYPPEVRTLREKKSQAELELMRCANEVTLLAIRAVRNQMHLGMTESKGREMIQDALHAAGLQDGGGLVLFGENAALPHGSGSDRILQSGDLILMDIGATLHGYTSDITRTFALPGDASVIPTRHLELWFFVHAAQIASLNAARVGVPARDVDAVAREVILDGVHSLNMRSARQSGRSPDDGDVNDIFPHRLGHGIGLDGHESPYLRGGEDNEAVIAANNTFSNEPGIYIPGDVGIRLEDCFYVSNEDIETDDESGLNIDGSYSYGQAVLFTERVGGIASSPWDP